MSNPSPTQHRTLRNPELLPIPGLILLVIAGVFLASTVGHIRVGGLRLSGWLWVATFLINAAVVARYYDRISMPLTIWAPWLVVIVIYQIALPISGSLQYSLQLLCPIIVGMAISTMRVDTNFIFKFYEFFRKVTIAFLVIVLCHVPVVFTLRLPEYSALAPQAIAALFFASVFMVSYTYGRRDDLLYYLLMAMVPVVALTRSAMAVIMAIVGCVIGPLRLSVRLGFIVISIGFAFFVFHTDRVQQMMFFSGSGEITDLRWDNPNLHTSGRTRLWDIVQEDTRRKPFWGHGPYTCAPLLARHGIVIKHPHNDWLRLLHDYGQFGTTVFAMCILIQILHLLVYAARIDTVGRVLFHGAVTAFFPYMLIMITDNVILYVLFYGNLHFMLIGLAYGHYAACADQPRHRQPVAPAVTAHTVAG